MGYGFIRFRCQNPILQVWDVDTALLERTQVFIFFLTFGPKVWYNRCIKLADM